MQIRTSRTKWPNSFDITRNHGPFPSVMRVLNKTEINEQEERGVLFFVWVSYTLIENLLAFVSHIPK